MKGVALVAVLLSPLPAVPAGADEVYVRGGGHLSGEVVERGPDSIVVDIGAGQIGLPLSAVERIVPGVSPIGLYRERAAQLAPGDTSGWLALGQWARNQDLDTNAREAFEHVLSVDPGNVAANRALGHVQVGRQWMTREEGYRARGYVPFEGGWVTSEEREAVLVERREAAEERRARAESEARVREAEARARAVEAEAQRAEAELAQTEVDLGASPWFPGDGFTPGFVTGFPALSYSYVGPYPFYGGFQSSFHGGFRSSFHAGFRSPFPKCTTGFGSFGHRQPHPLRRNGGLRTWSSRMSVKARGIAARPPSALVSQPRRAR